VSVDKEITEVADRCMKSPGGGPALLFTKPTLRSGAPSRLPVAVNLFGSERRMAMALGVESLDDIRRSHRGTAQSQGARFADGQAGDAAAARGGREVPAEDRQPSALSETVIKGADVDFSTFPVPICWPEDGGPVCDVGWGHHARPGVRRQERGDVPRAGAG